MTLEIRDKDEMIENVIEFLEDNLSFDIDTSIGEPIRTIIEAIMLELDYQYWQLEQSYNSAFIDSAIGDELSELIKILGIEREPAIASVGRVKFYRETPAQQNYQIPMGTIVETMPDSNGFTIQFETLEDITLLQDSDHAYADVRCLEPGEVGNVPIGKIIVINTPPNGIEEVINDEPIVGGREEEEDEALRERAKNLLNTVGLGTVDAIRSALNSISGVRSASVVDMARGINTVDALVLGDITPLPQSKIDEIKDVMNSVKPAGVDVLIKEPDLVSVDVKANITMRGNSRLSSIINPIIEAIEDYVNNLDIGSPLILNQLKKEILIVDDSILDIDISEPLNNITISSNEVIRVGNININEAN